MNDVKHGAFTLIELSIVLVIIGLIIGGVLVGRDLIKAATIRSTVAEIQEIQTALNTYRLKYNGLAGDHDNAFTFFGTACDTNAANCNGDGNKRIDSWTDEFKHVWTHMEQAGLLRLPGSDHIGRRRSALSGNTVYFIFYNGSYLSSSLGRGNALVFTRAGAASASWAEGGATPEEAYQIDRKMDDGVASTGKFVARDGQDDATATVEVCLSGTNYDLTLTGRTCLPGYWLH